ncbi:MAG: murein biosynthesis integral membrane protein MurJ [Phycisphaerae bacterium]|nr:murein biosynthesis integral membrane protein MurJ [Phycisphaerae bacterium]
MFKGFKQIAILTVISRVFGMVRDMSFAFFLGAGPLMDGWVIAFMIPNLSRRLFGEGAASSSFIPIYSEQLHSDKDKAYRLACTVVTVIFLLLTAVVIVGEVLIWAWHYFSAFEETKLKLELSGIMLPFMISICVTAILAGILNTHGHFAAPSWAPTVLNIFIIATLSISRWVFKMPPHQQVFATAVAVLAAGLVQLFMQMWPLHRMGIGVRPCLDVKDAAFRKIFILMMPMVLGLTVTQLNTMADIIIAKLLSGSMEKGEFFVSFGHQIKYPVWDGAVSLLYYSQRLYQFPLGVLGISLATAIFPVMSANAAKKDFSELVTTISRGLRGAIFIALPATAGLILVQKLLTSVIYQHGQFTGENTILAAKTLAFYSVGLAGFFMQQIVTRAFYAVQDSKTPMRSTIAAVLLNVILNLVLIWPLGIAGLALSTAICSYVQVAVLGWSLRKRFGAGIAKNFSLTLVKSAIATAIMYAAGTMTIYLFRNLTQTTALDTVRLLTAVFVSAGVYIIVTRTLKTEMLQLLFQRKLKNKSKRD